MTGSVPGGRQIPLVLASQSPSRRAVLVSAGILPIIRVSHVDEDAVLREEAGRRNTDVGSLDVETRVAVLARAKARTVTDEYRAIRGTAERAHGERITAFPLRAAGVGTEHGPDPASSGPNPGATGAAPTMDTRDFSGVDVPIRRDSLTPALTVMDDPGPGPLVLGCDSLFLFHGRCQGKPHDPAVARRRLLDMRGDSGELWTGHVLVDLAAGRVASGTSHARVRFGDFDERDVDAYVATGEPLEVAGSFTLEGFGGAFIDGVDGDPHGVLGLSLPLLRRLAGDLGVRWSELWNLAGADSGAGIGRTPVLAAPASSSTPKGNIHQPGDGWVDCACGRRHWGLNGAAGVLLARRDPSSGRVTHVVMQHRALWSAEGGTWGVPGGAIADGESPIQGALRESLEEASIHPQDVDVVGSWREEHGPWAYTTVFAFERDGRRVDPHAGDDESMEIDWVPVDEVASLRLLTALRVDWPRFRRRLDALAPASRGGEA